MSTSTATSDLNLRISFDSSQPRVKCYDFTPDLGIIRAFSIHRSHVAELARVLESQQYHRRDCIYILLNELVINYVGVSKSFIDRINAHKSKKRLEKSWDSAMVFVATRPILNTNIVQYAEYTLFVSLNQRGYLLLQDEPSEPLLNIDDQKIARQVVVEIERILGLLDLRQPPHPNAQTPPWSRAGTISRDVEEDVAALNELNRSNQLAVEVYLDSHGAQARGRYTRFGLEVYAGSAGTSVVQPHMDRQKSYWGMRTTLEESGVLQIDGNRLTFIQPFTFASPTAAARMLCGSNAPGPLRWKRTGDGTPLVRLKQTNAT